MCYWGVAFALGPNINAPITEEAAKDGVRRRSSRRGSAPAQRVRAGTRLHRGAGEALRRRSEGRTRAARSRLRRRDARGGETLSGRSRRGDALRPVADGHLAVELLGAGRQPARSSPARCSPSLESVLTRKPDHIGAIHLYIHAVEASPNPGARDAVRGQLAALVPGAGHLVHMPAHIYLRTGRYHDASVANQQRDQGRRGVLRGRRGAGQHDVRGRLLPAQHPLLRRRRRRWKDGGRRAEGGRRGPRAGCTRDMLRDPGMGGMVQHMHLTPLFTKMRFGMWDEVLAEPAPPADLPYHAARCGMRRAVWRMRRRDGSTRRRPSCAAVGSCKDDPSLKTLGVSSVNVASRSSRIGTKCSSARSQTRQKRADRGGAALRAGGGARGRPHLHGAARLADAGAPAARRGAARARPRARRPRRRSATT